MLDARFVAYVAVMAVLIVTPGPDTAVTIRNTLRAGRRGAVLTALGVGAGSLVWAVAAAVGAAGLLAASALVFTAFKLVGATFLVGLGVLTLVRARRPRPAAPRPTRGGSAFAQGLLNNLLNPKAGAIFLTVVPGFILAGDGWQRLAAMVAVYEVMIVGWLSLYGPVLGILRARVGPRLEHALEAVTGTVLVALGLRLALERR